MKKLQNFLSLALSCTDPYENYERFEKENEARTYLLLGIFIIMCFLLTLK